MSSRRGRRRAGFSNTLSAPFTLDDIPLIAENLLIRDISNLWPPYQSRWFGVLTFALNYHFGGLNTFGYHLVNIAIHCINAVLVYFLVLLTFKTAKSEELIAESQKQTAESRYSLFTFHYSQVTYVALFSALLFVSHPVQTQGVTYIVQRFTSLATLFYLLSLVLYIQFRLAIGNRHEAIGKDKQKVIGNRSEVRDEGQAGKAKVEVEVKEKTLKAFFSASALTLTSFFSSASASALTFYLLSLLSATLAMNQGDCLHPSLCHNPL